MGVIFKTLKGIFSEKANVEGIVLSVEKFFKLYMLTDSDDPHRCLALTFLSRQNPGKSVHKLMDIHRDEALWVTALFACIPPPLSARALGYFFAYKENINGIVNNQEFINEFNHLMEPVARSIDRGELSIQYNNLNPKRAGQFDEVLCKIKNLEEMGF